MKYILKYKTNKCYLIGSMQPLTLPLIVRFFSLVSGRMVLISTRKEIKMSKVVIEVKDSREDKEKAKVTIKIAGLEKASETEKGTTAMIYNKVCETLKSLN